MKQITSKHISKLIKGSRRDAAKQDKYVPQTVSILKLCNSYGTPEYFIQIRNRTLNEAEQHEQISEHMYLDTDNLADILLDETGVFLLSDILMGYFPDDDIMYLYRRLSMENKYGRSKHEFAHLLHGKSKKELKELLLEIAEKEVSTDQKEGKEYSIKVLRDEIGRRSATARLSNLKPFLRRCFLFQKLLNCLLTYRYT